MLTWLLAALLGAALSFLMYGLREQIGVVRALPPIALRAVALTVLIALVLNATAGGAREPAPLVALDVSRSWLREGGEGWEQAKARVRGLAADSLLVLGDSVRQRPLPDTPDDNASRVAPLVERALAAGRPVILVTDGEIEDASALRALPRGSRIEVLERSEAADAGVVGLDAPRAVVSGDTVEIAATVRAGRGGSPSRALIFSTNGREIARAAVDSLPAAGEGRVVVRAPIAGAEGPVLLSAALDGGDAEPGNDTLGMAVDVARAAGAVLVSTSPDQDSRFMVAVLRGAVSLPTRAYYRVAPGQWRIEGALARVAEPEVRRAMREAPLVALHGDTAIFGSPRAVTSGALLLAAPPRDATGEWYAVAAPPSPIAGALSGIAWDSLAPIEVSPGVPRGDWEGLITSRPRMEARRVAITGSAAGRRVVVVGASGMWRWRFRGGTGADAYAALWGGVFDWLTAEPVDRRAAVLADRVIRSGDRVRWRRGSGSDSVVMVLARRQGDTVGVDTMAIRFGASGTVAESDPMLPGVYNLEVTGGPALLVVNASPEMLPQRRTVASGAIGGAAVAGDAPPLRDRGWAYLLAVGALCAEWLVRRRMGLR
ncbi:MAG TPA: hypothetical protein VMM77_10935 [Gemmatimonadaceae bacterium]|nr:hypothetical protein [Gemmatimonadaceae bacterium]